MKLHAAVPVLPSVAFLANAAASGPTVEEKKQRTLRWKNDNPLVPPNQQHETLPPGTTIVGGMNAEKGDFPYYATPLNTNFVCGGSIIVRLNARSSLA